MAKWVNKLDLKDITDKVTEQQITPQGYCTIVADRLEALELKQASEDQTESRDGLVETFRENAASEGLDFDQVDTIMGYLYDWGDEPIGLNSPFGKKLCWISTQI